MAKTDYAVLKLRDGSIRAMTIEEYRTTDLDSIQWVTIGRVSASNEVEAGYLFAIKHCIHPEVVSQLIYEYLEQKSWQLSPGLDIDVDVLEALDALYDEESNFDGLTKIELEGGDITWIHSGEEMPPKAKLFEKSAEENPDHLSIAGVLNG